MSLSTQVKNEICRLFDADCCKKSFLSGVIHVNSSLNFDARGLSVLINCDHGLNIIESIFSSMYGNNYEINNSKLSFFNAKDILLDLDIFESNGESTTLNEGVPKNLTDENSKDCCKKSYLKGAFLASGTVSVPNVGYMFEILTNSKKLSLDLKEILLYFNIRAFNGYKNGKFRVYVRDKEGVCDCLAVIGATKSLLDIHSLAVERDLRRDLSRKANCDVYNADKALRTSMEQIKAINSVTLTDKKLIEVANARLNNPDFTYDELKNLLNVSKSTIKYRLNKIVKLYNQNKDN